MLKKIVLIVTMISVCFCIGCQKINTLFGEEKQNTASAKKTSQSECAAWIYMPSTRTIKNTMTEYSAPLEFVSNDITITEHLPKAKNLKPELEKELNAFIENLSSEFGDAVLSNIDFSILQQQTAVPVNSLQNRISIEGTLSFIGYYASIKLTATPSIINLNTNEEIELYSIEENTYYITKFYNVKEKREAQLQELFSDRKYISVLERCIQNKLLSENEEYFNILKRTFSNLSENDFSLYYDIGLDTDTEPHFLVLLNEQNPYCIGNTTVTLNLSLLVPYLSFSPNEVEDIMDIPNLLTKQFIDTTDTFAVQQDNSITIEGCEDTLFVSVRNYKNQSMTDRVNEQLDVSQRIYADTNPILNYMSKADSCSFKVVAYKGVGPFLKVFILSNATVNNQYLFNQRNILIHMPSGEQLSVRDLLLPESIDNLTELQQYHLDDTDFTLENSGKITVPLQPPAEDGTMNVVYESKLFDFSKYSNF